jgi:hypothetical protein
MGSDSEDYIFTLAYYIYWLSDLMMKMVLTVLTKTKEMICYCESFGYGGTTFSNIVANDLMHVSVPAEDR